MREWENRLTFPSGSAIIFPADSFCRCADIAQLVERLIRNHQVKGSSPFIGSILRGVAQFGSAFGSGPKGRGFKSRHLDQKPLENAVFSGGNLFFYPNYTLMDIDKLSMNFCIFSALSCIMVSDTCPYLSIVKPTVACPMFSESVLLSIPFCKARVALHKCGASHESEQQASQCFQQPA